MILIEFYRILVLVRTYIRTFEFELVNFTIYLLFFSQFQCCLFHKRMYLSYVRYILSLSVFSFLKFDMASNSRTLEFTAAVRGFHVFRIKWKPALNEQLHCLQEPANDFHVFSIKTCKPDKTTVGHLLREMSGPSKFMLDRGAEIVAEIESSHYRRSTLI